MGTKLEAKSEVKIKKKMLSKLCAKKQAMHRHRSVAVYKNIDQERENAKQRFPRRYRGSQAERHRAG